VLLDGAVVGAIYPIEQGFMFASVHATMSYDYGSTHKPPIPAWTFQLNPRPWHMGPNGQIVFDD